MFVVVVRLAPLFPSTRLLIGLMNCLSLLFLYLLRINLSLSMVCMVRKPLLSNVTDLALNDSSLRFLSAAAMPDAPPFDSLYFLAQETHHRQTTVIPELRPTGTKSNDLQTTARLFGAIINTTATTTAFGGFVSGNGTATALNASRWRRGAAASAAAADASAAAVGSIALSGPDEAPLSQSMVTAESNAFPDYLGGYDNVTFSEHTKNKGEFEWSRQFQGYVLSSYFYGYLVTQVLGGFLSGKYGTKHVLGTGMIIMVVMTMLTPAAARFNAYLLICLRILLGAAGGVFFPSVQSLWGPWAPPFERSSLVSLTFFGITLGNILALGASSLFCAVEVDNGWPLVFYVTGCAGFLFWLAWNFCVYSSPMQHPRISQRELAYIQRCIGNKSDTKKIERPPVPWLKIVTSPAVLAILTAQTANTWFTHTSITLPFYMKDVLKFDVKENGLFLILPYMLDMIVTPFVSKLADYLRVKKILSTVVVRKIYQSMSCVVCSILLITLSFMDFDRRYFAVGILCLIYPFQNLYRSGYASNLQDIAPKFAGEIFGITNTAGTICGIVSPVIVGALTTHGTKHEWQTVFYISAGFFLFGGLIFVIFARGEIQSWADPIHNQVLVVSEATLENGIKAIEAKSLTPHNEFHSIPINGHCVEETVPLNGSAKTEANGFLSGEHLSTADESTVEEKLLNH